MLSFSSSFGCLFVAIQAPLPATQSQVKPRPPQLPPATRSPPVPRTQAPLPLLHRAPHSRRSHPHQVTGTSPHQRPPQDALPSVITRMFGTVGVPPMVASFKPEADSLSALPRISETSGLSRLVVSLTPEDELPSAAPHVSETIGVSHLVVSLKPEDGLPSVPSRVTVICYDSAVDIRVKPEDGLPSEILRASEASDASIRTFFFFSGPRLTAPYPSPVLVREFLQPQHWIFDFFLYMYVFFLVPFADCLVPASVPSTVGTALMISD